MDVKSFTPKKTIVKLLIETSKGTLKLPVGTPDFRNQAQIWLELVKGCTFEPFPSTFHLSEPLE